jgi:hypothetical protein
VRGEKPVAHCPITDSELCRDLSQAVTLRLQLENPLPVHSTFRTTERLAISLCIANSGADPFANQVTLKLRDRRYDCKKRLPQRTTGVYVLLIADELDAKRPKFAQCHEQVLGGPCGSEPGARVAVSTTRLNWRAGIQK